MAQFVVDSETIAAKAAQAKTQVANISAEVTGMTASLQDLQGSWTGQSFEPVALRHGSGPEGLAAAV